MPTTRTASFHRAGTSDRFLSVATTVTVVVLVLVLVLLTDDAMLGSYVSVLTV
jgi:succinate dehydrogenase hydrophobic anchor subunit